MTEQSWESVNEWTSDQDKGTRRSALTTLFYLFIFFFLDAFSYLYKRVCPSVRPSVRLSVRPSVTHELKPCKSDQNYFKHERERILWPCIRPCSLILWKQKEKPPRKQREKRRTKERQKKSENFDLIHMNLHKSCILDHLLLKWKISFVNLLLW